MAAAARPALAYKWARARRATCLSGERRRQGHGSARAWWPAPGRRAARGRRCLATCSAPLRRGCTGSPSRSSAQLARECPLPGVFESGRRPAGSASDGPLACRRLDRLIKRARARVRPPTASELWALAALGVGAWRRRQRAPLQPSKGSPCAPNSLGLATGGQVESDRRVESGARRLEPPVRHGGACRVANESAAASWRRRPSVAQLAAHQSVAKRAPPRRGPAEFKWRRCSGNGHRPAPAASQWQRPPLAFAATRSGPAPPSQPRATLPPCPVLPDALPACSPCACVCRSSSKARFGAGVRHPAACVRRGMRAACQLAVLLCGSNIFSPISPRRDTQTKLTSEAIPSRGTDILSSSLGSRSSPTTPVAGRKMSARSQGRWLQARRLKAQSNHIHVNIRPLGSAHSDRPLLPVLRHFGGISLTLSLSLSRFTCLPLSSVSPFCQIECFMVR